MSDEKKPFAWVQRILRADGDDWRVFYGGVAGDHWATREAAQGNADAANAAVEAREAKLRGDVRSIRNVLLELAQLWEADEAEPVIDECPHRRTSAVMRRLRGVLDTIDDTGDYVPVHEAAAFAMRAAELELSVELLQDTVDVLGGGRREDVAPFLRARGHAEKAPGVAVEQGCTLHFNLAGRRISFGVTHIEVTSGHYAHSIVIRGEEVHLSVVASSATPTAIDLGPTLGVQTPAGLVTRGIVEVVANELVRTGERVYQQPFGRVAPAPADMHHVGVALDTAERGETLRISVGGVGVPRPFASACNECGEIPVAEDPGLSNGVCAFCAYWNVPPGPERQAMRARRATDVSPAASASGPAPRRRP